MNRHRTFTTLLLTALLSHCALIYAESNDETTVYVSGDILDTPCTIAPDSRMQVIAMGQITPGEIARNGAGQAIPFTIRLIDCRLQRIEPISPTGNVLPSALMARRMATILRWLARRKVWRCSLLTKLAISRTPVCLCRSQNCITASRSCIIPCVW